MTVEYIHPEIDHTFIIEYKGLSNIIIDGVIVSTHQFMNVAEEYSYGSSGIDFGKSVATRILLFNILEKNKLHSKK